MVTRYLRTLHPAPDDVTIHDTTYTYLGGQMDSYLLIFPFSKSFCNFILKTLENHLNLNDLDLK